MSFYIMGNCAWRTHTHDVTRKVGAGIGRISVDVRVIKDRHHQREHKRGLFPPSSLFYDRERLYRMKHRAISLSLKSVTCPASLDPQ